MWFNTRRENIHKTTLFMFFFVLFAQSFISWKALKKQQFGPVHIYVSEQTRENGASLELARPLSVHRSIYANNITVGFEPSVNLSLGIDLQIPRNAQSNESSLRVSLGKKWTKNKPRLDRRPQPGNKINSNAEDRQPASDRNSVTDKRPKLNQSSSNAKSVKKNEYSGTDWIRTNSQEKNNNRLNATFHGLTDRTPLTSVNEPDDTEVIIRKLPGLKKWIETIKKGNTLIDMDPRHNSTDVNTPFGIVTDPQKDPSTRLVSGQLLPQLIKFSAKAVDQLIAKESQASRKISELVNRLDETVSQTKLHCPTTPPNLTGRIQIVKEAIPLDKLKQRVPDVSAGGRWSPTHCKANHHVAIIIPYRDRPDQLRILLTNLHPLLQKQELAYGIYVIEMSQPTTFNRGLLMNVGFEEAKRFEDYQCFIFHDVDLIPEDDRNLYSCPAANRPRHMSVAVSSMQYRLPYLDLFGGVSAMTKEQYLTVNGFSNLYFGWGAEDDDLSYRLRHKGYTISRYSPEVARYTMLNHKRQSRNPNRMKLLNEAHKRAGVEGLNTLKYHLIKLELRDLYTWVFVDVTEKDIDRMANN